MRLGALLLLGFEVACLEAPPGSGEPGGDAAPDGQPACERFSEWETVGRPILPDVELAYGPTVSRDEQLLLYFTDDGTIGIADRAGDQFRPGDPALLAGVNSAMSDRNPTLSDDGLTVWFTRGTLDGTELFVSHRDGRGSPFPDAVPVSGLGGVFPEGPDVWDPGGEVFYSVLVASHHNIARATCASVDSCTQVELIDIGDQNHDWYPTIRGDGLELVYVNSVAGMNVARRSLVSQSFEDVETLDVLGEDPELSWDGATLYFSSGGILTAVTRSCLQ